jgi:hypothetical protein
MIGTPITNLTQANNTYSLSDNFSKVVGNHTVKWVVYSASSRSTSIPMQPLTDHSFSLALKLDWTQS